MWVTARMAIRGFRSRKILSKLLCSVANRAYLENATNSGCTQSSNSCGIGIQPMFRLWYHGASRQTPRDTCGVRRNYRTAAMIIDAAMELVSEAFLKKSRQKNIFHHLESHTNLESNAPFASVSSLE